MEPSHAERARTLVYLGRTGTLSTQSLKHPGWPFGSVMPYAPDESGRPVFLISGIAVHARNLVADPRASLLIAQPELQEDPLAGPRVILLGTVEPAAARTAAARDAYLERHPRAAAWVDFQDFGFHILDLKAVYFVGGFGAMGWIPLEEYAAARPDPLADAAVDLIYQTNLHYAHSLARLVETVAGEHAETAWMTAVDRLGFQLRYTAGEHTHDLRVPFGSEARDADEAKAALMALVRHPAH